MADFASSLRLADVPEEVIARAKGLILDGLGCGLYGSDLRWTRILAGVVKRLEPMGGQASIWGRSETASATNAALVNGTMVQGYELDDAHIGGALHTCSIVLPAAFAAAELVGAGKVDAIHPSTSIVAENPVAVVERTVAKKGTGELAKAYLNYLYSDEGQEIAAKHAIRPRSPAVLKKYSNVFKPIQQFTVKDYFGSLGEAQKVHFNDGGQFDKLYTVK